MKSYGSKDPGVFSVEQIPSKEGWALARFYENAEPYIKTRDGIEYSGYKYDEYHLELLWYEALETDISNNLENMLHQAKIADAQAAFPEDRILGMQRVVNGMLGIDTEVNGEAWFLVENQDAAINGVRGSLDNLVAKIVDVPAEINGNMYAIKMWEPGPFTAGDTNTPPDVRMHLGNPYKCRQSHDSTGNPGWNPVDAPALWVHYHGTTPETARPFVAEGHNPYMKGEYCTENDKTYCCNTANTIHAPSVYPQAWDEVA